MALQQLASLTRLTELDLSGTGVSAGLAQLTSLKGLGSLTPDGCVQITDEHLQPLSALTGLTRLNVRSTGVQQGSSLAALASLRSLKMNRCSNLGAAALAQVAQLTRHTFLNIGYSARDAGPAQLAQLAQLTNLQELRAWGHSIRGDAAAALLELPSLEELAVDSLAMQQGQDISSSALTRLVLEEPADLQSLPQLPALHSLIIGTATAGTISSIRVQQQLAQLVVGRCEDVQAGELAAALQGLRQLMVLELGHAACFDRQCLLAVAGMSQLQELWLDGGSEGLAPGVGDCLGVLQRCCGLREVTLQRCGAISKGALIALVSQAGMRQVVLSGLHSMAASAVSWCGRWGPGSAASCSTSVWALGQGATSILISRLLE
jgi:hypothetical protein